MEAPEPKPAPHTTLRERIAAARPLVLVALVFVAQFHLLPRALNHAGVLLPRHHFEAPHHYEAAFSYARHCLATSGPVDMVVTGDSRAGAAINPELIDALRAFTLTCGCQAVLMTEPMIVDSIRKCGQSPRFLLIGVSPDYLSAAADTDVGTLAYLDYYATAEKLRASASWLTRAIQRWFPALYYRQLVLDDWKWLVPELWRLVPPVELSGMPITRPMSWSDYMRLRKGAMTARGWTQELFGPFVAGGYPPKHGVRGLLKQPYRANREGLARLVASLRKQGIEPLLTVIPLHDSFYRVHGMDIREAVERCVADVCREADVTHLIVPFDTADPSSWYDGHHMSAEGATRFSTLLGARIRAVVAGGELERRHRAHASGGAAR